MISISGAGLFYTCIVSLEGLNTKPLWRLAVSVVLLAAVHQLGLVSCSCSLATWRLSFVIYLSLERRGANPPTGQNTSF